MFTPFCSPSSLRSAILLRDSSFQSVSVIGDTFGIVDLVDQKAKETFVEAIFSVDLRVNTKLKVAS